MTTIIDSNGKPAYSISGDEDVILLSTPSDCFAVNDPPKSNMFYRNGWVEMPAQPSPHFIFDYEVKQWIDPRSLDEIKAQKWTEIKSERDRLEFGGFEFDGNIYDSDQVSQGRITGAASAGIDQTWTLADNTTVELSASQLQQLYAALQAHIASVHERGRIARQLIFDAETKEQVEAVQLQHLRVLFYYQNLGGLMTDNESYGVRVEKKIDSMQSDIRMLSDHVTRLTFINEAHQNMSAENRKDIDSIITRVGVLENKSAQLDGGLNVIRIALTLLAGVFIGVCTWVGSSIIQNAQENSLLKEKTARLESDVSTIRNYQK